MGVQSIEAEDDQFAYRYDTQLLIERRDEDLDEDDIADYITEHFDYGFTWEKYDNIEIDDYTSRTAPYYWYYGIDTHLLPAAYKVNY